MSQYDFSQRRNNERRYFIELDQVTKHNLLGYISNELTYYNELVNGLNSKLRVFPNEILAIKDRYERLWATIAQTSIDIRSFAKKDIASWPSEFTEFRSTIVDGNRIIISDKMMMLYDIARTSANIDPLIRRSIAIEILHWIMPQAKSIVDSEKNINGHMSSAVQLLQPLDLRKKRNLQLFKNTVDVKYNKELHQSTINIPYSSTPIVIKGHDVNKFPFDNVLIKCTPVSKGSSELNWSIVLKEGSGRYLLDYTDSFR